MNGYFWLASYPKSGNTWLRLALNSLARGGKPPDFSVVERFAPIASDRAPLDLLLDVDSADLSADEADALRPAFFEIEAQSSAEPQIRKVHDAWTLTPVGKPLFPLAVTLGTIYIVRDPRDVAVSLAHHLASDLDQTIAFMGHANAVLATGGRYGSPQFRQKLLTWAEHVRSWLNAPKPPLLLRYEDMLTDPATALKRAARHLGWEAPHDRVEKAVAATRFEALQRSEEQQGFREKAWPEVRFFRRGISGGWRDTLTAAQAARIEADHGHIMAKLGYR